MCVDLSRCWCVDVCLFVFVCVGLGWCVSGCDWCVLVCVFVSVAVFCGVLLCGAVCLCLLVCVLRCVGVS